jgi:hypothetical protein
MPSLRRVLPSGSRGRVASRRIEITTAAVSFRERPAQLVTPTAALRVGGLRGTTDPRYSDGPRTANADHVSARSWNGAAGERQGVCCPQTRERFRASLLDLRRGHRG